MSALSEPRALLDGRGRALRLGRRLGQGGEGTVFEIDSDAQSVAKIYHQPMTAPRAAKIRAMLDMRSEPIERLTSWPMELVATSGGVPVGVKLPRLVGYSDIHLLYSPKSRRTQFPRADWRFLVRAAANLARAFATVHDTGRVVVADVNPSGVLVGPDARVRLIDCDGFQVGIGDRSFPCDVGVPSFTPPELQGRPFVGLLRTPNHDNFGFAVLIFLLLFMGRHPFAGRYRGDAEMPIENAIQHCRFAYGAAQAAAVERPPGTLPLQIASPEIALLFERAFGQEGAAGVRPSARDWIEALDQLEGRLAQCPASPVHWHYAGLSDCPWCHMEAATGVPLFSATLPDRAARAFDLDGFWRQVEAVEHPGPAPVVEHPRAADEIDLSEHVAHFRRRRRWHVPIALLAAALPMWVGLLAELPPLGSIFFFVSAFVLYFLMRRVLRNPSDTLPFFERERAAREAWERMRADWQAKAGPGTFEAKRAELDRLRQEWIAGPNDRAKLEVLMRKALTDLVDLHNRALFARVSLRSAVEQAHLDYLQCAADLEATSK